jgi:pimeloyl-ACP methyl ester carboxylesterase
MEQRLHRFSETTLRCDEGTWIMTTLAEEQLVQRSRFLRPDPDRTATSADATPFRIEVSDAAIRDLKERLARTRWPVQSPGEGWTRGVPDEYLRELSRYWQTEYDWREHEARLNEHPQFTVSIDGQTIHFMVVRSAEPTARPLMLIHGWPGSFVEFTDVIAPLSDPRAHGGDPRDAFELVIPSIPGHGFSMPLVEAGWTHQRIALAFTKLMSRLGYERYGVQGGDAGSAIAPWLGRLDPEHVAGVHTNALVQLPAMLQILLASVISSRAERKRIALFKHYFQEMMGYAQIQGTRPKTLTYGLNDSPVGQLAWIIEKFKEWVDPSAALPDEAVARDTLLTNASLYWFSGTAGTSANLYYEALHDPQLKKRPPRNQVPTGVLVSTQDVTIRRWAERENNIVHWTELHRGGHFAALEAPEAFVRDVRKFFRGISFEGASRQKRAS